MRKYYTRPCNFYYGKYAKELIKSKKGLPLTGNQNIAFDQIELFIRNKKKSGKSKIYSITEINSLDKEKASVIKTDIKRITSKRKDFAGLKFNNPQIMGVLNITPDSFSDGGLFFDEVKAYNQANLMINGGATIIDIGGESTRPGSKIVNEKNEWDRIKNTISKLKKSFPDIPLSLDTRKAYVMKKGVEHGVNIINDVSGLSFDKKSFDFINLKKTPFILHHMQGTPETMQDNPKYDDALLDIYDFFEKKINYCLKKNYKRELIIIDPGIGFGKTTEHNLALIANIEKLVETGWPVLLGASRKRFLGEIASMRNNSEDNDITDDRLEGSIAVAVLACQKGVEMIRVHDVAATVQAVKVTKVCLKAVNGA